MKEFAPTRSTMAWLNTPLKDECKITYKSFSSAWRRISSDPAYSHPSLAFRYLKSPMKSIVNTALCWHLHRFLVGFFTIFHNQSLRTNRLNSALNLFYVQRLSHQQSRCGERVLFSCSTSAISSAILLSMVSSTGEISARGFFQHQNFNQFIIDVGYRCQIVRFTSAIWRRKNRFPVHVDNALYWTTKETLNGSVELRDNHKTLFNIRCRTATNR